MDGPQCMRRLRAPDGMPRGRTGSAALAAPGVLGVPARVPEPV